jgi:AraC-like DNA-binding protein
MGEIFIAYPHELHSTGPNPENRHVWLGLCLDNIGPAGEGLARQIRKAGARILPGCQDIAPLLHAIISQVVTMRHERAHVVRALIDAFVALLKQRLDCTQDRSYQTFRILPYSPGVQRALVYMGQCIDHRLPLRDLARAAMARSVPNFCSQFRREVGVTPAAYHVSMRLEAAREMLSQPDFDITNAAMQSGFSSSQHFSTLFKRAFGVTPRIWKTKGSTGDVILFKRAFGVTPRIWKTRASTGEVIPVSMILPGSPRPVSSDPCRSRGSGISAG